MIEMVSKGLASLEVSFKRFFYSSEEREKRKKKKKRSDEIL